MCRTKIQNLFLAFLRVSVVKVLILIASAYSVPLCCKGFNSQGSLPAHYIIELHPLCKPQPLVNLHGPGVVVPYMQERRLTSVIDALHERSHQSSCVSAAEVVRMRGHRGDLTISRDMQPQTTHGYQLAFNTHAHKRA